MLSDLTIRVASLVHFHMSLLDICRFSPVFLVRLMLTETRLKRKCESNISFLNDSIICCILNLCRETHYARGFPSKFRGFGIFRDFSVFNITFYIIDTKT